MSAHAQAPEGPAAIIVFDNSGSMWGKVEGDAKGNKFSLAREAVAKTLPKLAPATRVGLATFGRRRGDCSDVEIVAKPEPGLPDRITEPLERLNPKGRGPLVLTLREAAKAAGPQRPASLILIHDDPDNCQQDVCALGNEIRRDHPGLRVHLVSIGMKKEDVARMSCLAEATGGKQYDAQNATQLASFIEEALTSSAGGPRPVAVPAPVPATRPSAVPAASVPVPAARTSRRPTPAPSQGKPGLWLSAVLVRDGALAEGAVSWTVTKASPAAIAAGETAPVAEAVGSEARVELPPGSYAVEARWGQLRARETFEVLPDRPTAASVPLNAGVLQVMTRAQAGGAPIDQVTYRLYTSGAAEPAAPVLLVRDPAEPIGLPPGSYRLVAERGFARTEKPVAISVGEAQAVELDLGAGLLTVRAAAREDGDTLTNALFIVAADGPEGPQAQREITRSAAPVPDFVLPAGTYTVTTRIGEQEARERIPVGPGESVRRTIILGLGRLALNTRLEQAGGAPSPAWREPLTVRVLRKDGDGREIAKAAAGQQSLELPAGSYRVEAQIGGQNAKLTRDVDLQAGRTTQLSFELPAARASLKLADALASGGATSDISWEVRDEAGKPIWRTGLAAPQLVLAPGRYTARVSVRERRAERVFLLKAGEQRVIEVGSE